MRYIELQRLWDNPTWYNKQRNIIHLPPEGQLKHKRTQQERTIHPLTINVFGYNENISCWKKTAS